MIHHLHVRVYKLVVKIVKSIVIDHSNDMQITNI